jgi:CBS domain-containing protein
MDTKPDQTRWMSVNNAMTKDVISVKATASVRDAWIVFMETGISGAPVVDDSGALVGVLSITDIFRAVIDRVQKARSLREATFQSPDPAAVEKEEIRELSLALRAVTEGSVANVLPKDQKLLTLSPGDSFDRAIHLMAEHHVNRLPVVRENQVVGIITRQDVIWQIAGRPSKGQE